MRPWTLVGPLLLSGLLSACGSASNGDEPQGAGAAGGSGPGGSGGAGGTHASDSGTAGVGAVGGSSGATANGGSGASNDAASGVDAVDAPAPKPDVDAGNTLFPFELCPVVPSVTPPAPCGPSACSVLSDDIVVQGDFFAEPALALVNDLPTISYGFAEIQKKPGGIAVFNGTWTLLPVSNARFIGLSNEAHGALTFSAYDGSFQIAVHSLQGSAVQPLGSLSGIPARNMVLDGCGRTHLVVGRPDASSRVAYGRVAADVQSFDLPGGYNSGDIAMAANGDLHIAYFVHDDSNNQLGWVRNGVAMGNVPVLGNTVTSVLVAATSNAESSKMHAVYRHGITPYSADWRYVRGDADGSMNTAVLIADSGPQNCYDLTSPAEGTTCAHDWTQYWVEDVVGDVSENLRWIASSVREQSQLVWACYIPSGSPTEVCSWKRLGDPTITTGFELLWLDGDTVHHSALAGATWSPTDAFISRNATRIDSTGKLHIAYQDGDGAWSSVRIRHLVLGI